MGKWKKNSTFGPSGKNSKGFALIGLLTVLPLIFISLAGLTLWLAALRDVNFASSRCRYHALLSQEKMARLLDSLLDLNPEAKKLQLARKLAEHELRIAKLTAQPEAIILAEAHLASVLSGQSVLRLQQERILFQARTIRFRTIDMFNADTLPLLGKSMIENNGTLGLAVIPSPLRDASPEYLLRPNFDKQQTLVMKWQFQIHSRIPLWLKEFVNDATSKGHCAATLKKEVDLWHAHLVAVRL